MWEGDNTAIIHFIVNETEASRQSIACHPKFRREPRLAKGAPAASKSPWFSPSNNARVQALRREQERRDQEVITKLRWSEVLRPDNASSEDSTRIQSPVARRPRERINFRKFRHMAEVLPAEAFNGPGSESEEDDLFGDVEETGDQNGDQKDDQKGNQTGSQTQTQKSRTLDDTELDSADDENRRDRAAETVEEDGDEEYQSIRTMNVNFARIQPPVGDEMYLLNLPPFLGLNHRGFQPSTYQPPTKPYDTSNVDPTTKFSPYDTAMSTVFWRRDPKTPSLLQSNARVIRWSDGSLTLQSASDATKQYTISTQPLHQRYNPKTNSLHPTRPPVYDPTKDSNNYLVAPHGTVGFDFQITRPLDAALKIEPTIEQDKLAIQRLQAKLNKNHPTFDPFANLKTVRVDPEKAKKDAEDAEKKVVAQRRKIQNAQEREGIRREGVLRRGGMGRAGLSIAGLEDDDGMPTARGTKPKRRGPRRNRRGSIYSDDEDDDLPRGRGREDEYDREDDFVAASDEEPETYEDDEEELPEDEEEDAEGEVDDEPAPVRERERVRNEGRAREATPKRPAEDKDDAGVVGSPQARKKRRVIDDEDDE